MDNKNIENQFSSSTTDQLNRIGSGRSNYTPYGVVHAPNNEPPLIMSDKHRSQEYQETDYDCYQNMQEIEYQIQNDAQKQQNQHLFSLNELKPTGQSEPASPEMRDMYSQVQLVQSSSSNLADQLYIDTNRSPNENNMQEDLMNFQHNDYQLQEQLKLQQEYNQQLEQIKRLQSKLKSCNNSNNRGSNHIANKLSGHDTGTFNTNVQNETRNDFENFKNNDYVQTNTLSQGQQSDREKRMANQISLKSPLQTQSQQRFDKENIPLVQPVMYNARSSSSLVRNSRNKSQRSQGSHSSIRAKSNKSHHSGGSRISRTASNISGRSHSVNNTKINHRTIPDSIHSSQNLDSQRNMASLESQRSSGAFAQRFQSLYDNIIYLYPNFQKDTGSSTMVRANLMQSDNIPAVHVFSQLNYLYSRLKELRIKEIRSISHQSDDNELKNIMKDQTEVENNMLKFQIDKVVRETNYYKKQIEQFKEQLQLQSLRERDLMEQNDRTIQDLVNQNNSYLDQIEDLQKKLDGFDKDSLEGAMSFRGNQKNIKTLEPLSSQFASPQVQQPPIQYQEPKPNLEDARLIMSLQNEIKDLRFELKSVKPQLKMQEEKVGFEQEQRQALNEKIQNLRQSFEKEMSLKVKENIMLQQQNSQHTETIKMLNTQLDDFTNTVSLEFPIVCRKDMGPATSPGFRSQPAGITLSNQNKSQPKFVSMTGNKKQPVTDNEDLLDSFFNQMPFGDEAQDDDLYKMQKNLQMPMARGKSGGAQKKKQPKANKDPNTKVASMFDLSQIAQTQISSVLLADKVMLEQKQMHQDKLDKMEAQIKIYESLEERVESIYVEKREFNERQVKLTKENEDLKIKFSQLLDQFQEYVNETERKIEEDNTQQKEEQEKLLNDLNNTIKDLEEMSKNLQQECLEKDQLIKQLESEKKGLEADYELMKEQMEKQDDHVEGLQKVKIQSLNEEISYLKKHYMVEMDVLRQENKELRQQKSNNNLTSYDAERMRQSPLGHQEDPDFLPERENQFSNEKQLNFTAQQCSMRGRQMNNDYPSNVNILDRGSMTQIGWKTPGPNSHADLRISRQKSNLLRQRSGDHNNDSNYNIGRRGNYANANKTPDPQREFKEIAERSQESKKDLYRRGLNPYELEDHPESRFSERQDNSLLFSGGENTQIYDPNVQFRSKSQDRVMPRKSNHKDLRFPQDRSNSNRVDSREAKSGFNSRNQSLENQPKRAKEILSGAQSTFDGLKRELVDRDRMIEQKNREIVKLRMENDEFKSNFSNAEPLTLNQQQRNKIINEFDQITETLKIELERSKINLFKSEDPVQVYQMPFLRNQESKTSQNYQMIPSEEKMMSLITERVKNLRDLVSLASEIFLLSNKHKYNYMNDVSQFRGGTPQEREYHKILQDNALLQRTVYKYEVTLTDLDQIFRRDDSKDEMIFELKKLTESQLTEIVKLQQDIDTLQRRCESEELIEKQNYHHSNQENQSILQENRVLKQEIEMLREHAARNEQLHQGNEELNNERRSLLMKVEQLESKIPELQNNVNDKDKQLEDLRQRITIVAELFEKKTIKQRYSFEVLCDFIHDKAKRLFSKYDNVVKEKKAMQDEKSYYYQRKITSLEKENDQMKDAIQLLKSNILPKVTSMLNKQHHAQDIERMNTSFLRDLFDDLEYQFKKFKTDSIMNSQSQERIQELQSMVDRFAPQQKQFPHQQSVNTFSGSALEKIPQQHNMNEFDQMRQEKIRLNGKLEEFSSILKEFQVNQRQYVEENNQLKQQVMQLEKSSIGNIHEQNTNMTSVEGVYSHLNKAVFGSKAITNKGTSGFVSSGPNVSNLDINNDNEYQQQYAH